MPQLRFEPVNDANLEDWRFVHNVIIPAAALSTGEVRERLGRNHLEVAYLGKTLLGCATVRPPAKDSGVATVIVRILPGYRRHGYGEVFLRRELAYARALGATAIETVVWEPNQDGLRFATAHGFTEVSRHLPAEGAPAFITLWWQTS